MKISIITICFNSESTIVRALESVKAQSYRSIEHIIVDGGSTDNTLSLVKQHAREGSVIISEPDEGIYDAMSKGVKLATGDSIGVLNSDDFLADDQCIAEVVKAFNQNPDSDMVFGDVVFINPDQSDGVTRYYSSAHFRPWKLRFGWMPPHPATYVRKSVYDRFGTYKKHYKISADYERFVRWLLVEKIKYARFDKILVVMQEGGVSTKNIANRVLLNKEIVQACRENGVRTNLFMLLFKIPFKLFELVKKPSRRLNFSYSPEIQNKYP